ncbi:MAG: hypothetical protein HY299_23005 [Verrucomicrobia bacterium]|nr:hypothetical protein [Verrucomicrobiota bacterium]
MGANDHVIVLRPRLVHAIESLSAGIPVVATDYSACTELVRDRGELVKILTTLTVGSNLIEQAVL